MYTWARQHGVLLTKADLTVSTECQICQHQRPALSPSVAPFSEVINQQPSERLTILEHFHCGTFSLGRDSCVGMGLPFLHIILLPKLIFTEAHRWCAHHHGTPHSIASNQGTVFIAREVQQCDHTHRLNSHWVQCLQDADSHYWYYYSVSVLQTVQFWSSREPCRIQAELTWSRWVLWASIR